MDTEEGINFVSALDRKGRTIRIVGAHRDDGRRLVVHAEEKLTAFLELDAVVRGHGKESRAQSTWGVERARRR